MADGEEEEKKVFAGAGGDKGKQIVVDGAGDDQEKNVVRGEGSGSGNGNVGQFRPPPGFRFTPREDELVRYYLLPKLQGREHVPNDAIIEDNVYQSHPDTLIDKYKDKGEESWYFLSPRARKYHNGNRPSRSTEDNRGRWKASTGTKEYGEDGGDKVHYSDSVLAYHQGPIKKEIKTKWLMKELTVPDEQKRSKKNGGGGGGDRNMLDKYVMCKIYVTPRKKGDKYEDVDEDEAGPSGTQYEPEVSGQGTTTAGREKLSEKQAGKRPAKDQSFAAKAQKRAHQHPNPDRLHLGPPAPLYGNAMQAPFMPAPGYYGGGPGRPMGYYARAPGPRPPVAYNGQAPAGYNNGQVHAPRQQVAYNGQVAHLPRQQAAYSGQVPVPRQQMAYRGQMMQAPVLKLSPPFRPAAAGTPISSGQNQTMMQRPPCPAGQAVKNPPSSSVEPRPAQMQKQPETEEMRAHRVIQQHMEEYSRIMQSSKRPPASAAHVAQQQRPPAPFTHQQQQRPMMAFTHQQQQRPYFGANPSYHHHHAGAMVPQFSLDNFYASEAAQHYLHSRVVPAANGSSGASTVPASAKGLVSSVVSGAGNEVSGANRDCSNDEEMELVESAAAGGSASAAEGDGPKYESAAQ